MREGRRGQDAPRHPGRGPSAAGQRGVPPRQSRVESRRPAAQKPAIAERPGGSGGTASGGAADGDDSRHGGIGAQRRILLPVGVAASRDPDGAASPEDPRDAVRMELRNPVVRRKNPNLPPARRRRAARHGEENIVGRDRRAHRAGRHPEGQRRRIFRSHPFTSSRTCRGDALPARDAPLCGPRRPSPSARRRRDRCRPPADAGPRTSLGRSRNPGRTRSFR